MDDNSMSFNDVMDYYASNLTDYGDTTPMFQKTMEAQLSLERKYELAQQAEQSKSAKLHGIKEGRLRILGDEDSGTYTDAEGNVKKFRLKGMDWLDAADTYDAVQRSDRKYSTQPEYVASMYGITTDQLTPQHFANLDAYQQRESIKQIIGADSAFEKFDPTKPLDYYKKLGGEHGEVDIPIFYRSTNQYDKYGRELIDIANPITGKSIANTLANNPYTNTEFSVFKGTMATPDRLARESAYLGEPEAADFNNRFTELKKEIDAEDTDGYLGEAADLFQASTAKALKSSAQTFEYFGDRAYDFLADKVGDAINTVFPNFDSKTAKRLREITTQKNQDEWQRDIDSTDQAWGVKFSTREEQNKQSREFHDEILKAFDNSQDFGSFAKQFGEALWNRVSEGKLHLLADNLGSTAVMLTEAAAATSLLGVSAPVLATIGLGSMATFAASHPDTTRAVIGGLSSASMNIPDYVKEYKENHNGKEPSATELMTATALFTVSGALDAAIDFGVMKGKTLTGKVFNPITELAQNFAPGLVNNKGTRSILRSMLVTVLKATGEGLSEFPQEGFDQAIQSIMSDKNFDLTDYKSWDFKKYAPDILEAASIGAVTGVASGPIIGNRVTNTLISGTGAAIGRTAGTTLNAGIIGTEGTVHYLTDKFGITSAESRENKVANKITEYLNSDNYAKFIKAINRSETATPKPFDAQSIKDFIDKKYNGNASKALRNFYRDKNGFGIKFEDFITQPTQTPSAPTQGKSTSGADSNAGKPASPVTGTDGNTTATPVSPPNSGTTGDTTGINGVEGTTTGNPINNPTGISNTGIEQTGINNNVASNPKPQVTPSSASQGAEPVITNGPTVSTAPSVSPPTSIATGTTTNTTSNPVQVGQTIQQPSNSGNNTKPTSVSKAMSALSNLSAEEGDEVGKVQQVLHNAAKALQLDKAIKYTRAALKSAIDNASEKAPVFVIDLETSTHTNGVPNQTIDASKIGQIGVAKITSPTGKPTVSSTFVKGINILTDLAPANEAHDKGNFQKVYEGLSEDQKVDVATALKTLVKTLTGLDATPENKAAIENTTVTVIGHNFINFDNRIIQRIAKENGISLPHLKIYDTLDLSRVSNPHRGSKGSHKLEVLAKILGLSTENEHTADVDVGNNLEVAKALANIIDDTESKSDIAEVITALKELQNKPKEVIKSAYSYLASLSNIANSETEKENLKLLLDYYKAIYNRDVKAANKALDAIAGKFDTSVSRIEISAKKSFKRIKEIFDSKEFKDAYHNRDDITLEKFKKDLTECLNDITYSIIENVLKRISRYNLQANTDTNPDIFGRFFPKSNKIEIFSKNTTSYIIDNIFNPLFIDKPNKRNMLIDKMCNGEDLYSSLVQILSITLIHENTHGIFHNKILPLLDYCLNTDNPNFDAWDKNSDKLVKEISFAFIDRINSNNSGILDIVHKICDSYLHIYTESILYYDLKYKNISISKYKKEVKKLLEENSQSNTLSIFADEILAHYIAEIHVIGVDDKGHVIKTLSGQKLDKSFIDKVEGLLKTIYTGLYNILGEAVFEIFGKQIPLRKTISDKEFNNFLDALSVYATYADEITDVDSSNNSTNPSLSANMESITDVTQAIQSAFTDAKIEINQSSLKQVDAKKIFNTDFDAANNENGDNKKNGLLNALTANMLDRMSNFKFGRTVITTDVIKDLFDPSTELGKAFNSWKNDDRVKSFLDKAIKAYKTNHRELSVLTENRDIFALTMFLAEAWFTNPKTVAMLGNKINDYQLESLFNISDKDEVAKSQARAFLQQNGLPLDILTSQLGQYITQTLGLVPNRDKKQDAFALERLQKSLGSVATEFLVHSGILSKPKELSKNDLGFEPSTRIIDESPVDYFNTFQQYINSFYSGTKDKVEFIQFNSKAERGAKSYRSYIQTIIDGCNLEYTFSNSPRLTKDGFIAPNYVHNSNGVSKVNAEQKKEMDRLSKIAYRFNSKAMEILKRYNLNSILESGIMGNTPVSQLTDLTYDQKQSALGKISSVVRDLQMTLAAYTQQTSLGKDFNGFFYDYIVAANGRMMVINNTVNIQSDKQTNRYLQYSSVDTYETNNDKNSESYILQAVAIAQAFGAYGNQAQTEQFFDTMSKLSTDELNRLLDLMFTNKESFLTEMKKITGRDIEVESMGKTLMGFVHLLERQEAIKNGKKTFESSIKIENDSTISGTVIRLLQVPVVKILNKFGASLGIGKVGTKLVNIAVGKKDKTSGYQDLYNIISKDAKNKLSTLDTTYIERNYPTCSELFNQIGHFLSNINSRDLIKQFGIVFFYGGGKNSASAGITDSIIDTVFRTAMPLLKDNSIKISVSKNGTITLNDNFNINSNEHKAIKTLETIINNVANNSINNHKANDTNQYNLKEQIIRHINDGTALAEIYNFFANNSFKNINIQTKVPAKWERKLNNGLTPVKDSDNKTILTTKTVSLYEYFADTVRHTYGQVLFDVFDSTFKAHRVFNSYISAMFANAQNMYIQAFKIAMRDVPKDKNGNYNITFEEYKKLLDRIKPMMPAISTYYAFQGDSVSSEDLMFSILKLDKTHFTNDNVIKINQSDIDGNIKELVASLGVFKTTGLAAAVLPIHNIDGSVMLSTQRKHGNILSVFDALIGTPREVALATPDYNNNLLEINKNYNLFNEVLFMFEGVSQSFNDFLKENNATAETYTPTGMYFGNPNQIANTSPNQPFKKQSKLISINGITDTGFLTLPSSLDGDEKYIQPLDNDELLTAANKIADDIDKAKDNFYDGNEVVENMSNLFFGKTITSKQSTTNSSNSNSVANYEIIPTRHEAIPAIPFSAATSTQKAVARSIGNGFKSILMKGDAIAVPLISKLMYAARSVVQTQDLQKQEDIIKWVTSDSFKKGVLNSSVKLTKLAWAWMRLPASSTMKRDIRITLSKVSREAFNGAVHDFWINYRREFLRRDNWSKKLEEIQALRKKIEAIVEREVNISKNYNESLFSKNGKVISNEDKKHLTKALLLTDAQALLYGDEKISVEQLIEYLKNPDKFNQYKESLIKKLNIDDKAKEFLLKYSKVLANYMVTREGNILVNTDTNTDTIIESLSQTTELATLYKSLDTNQKQELSSILDKIITIEAMQRTNKESISRIGSLDVDNLSQALSEYLDQQHIIVSHRKAAKNKAHQGKGYIKSIVDSSVGFEKDLADEETIRRRARTGWILEEISVIREANSQPIKIGYYKQKYTPQRHLEGMALSFIGAERILKSLQTGSFSDEQISALQTRVNYQYNKLLNSLAKPKVSAETIIKAGKTHLNRSEFGKITFAPVSYTEGEQSDVLSFDAFDITARMQASEIALDKGIENNDRLFNFMHKAMEDAKIDSEGYDKQGYKWYFITPKLIGSNGELILDKKLQDMFYRLPLDMRKEIQDNLLKLLKEQTTENKQLAIREDWIIDVFGSKTLSLADTKWSQIDPKLNGLIRRIEYLCRFVASGAKNNIVILMPKVAASNICSNVFYHTLVHGIDPFTAAKKEYEMVKLLTEYQKVLKEQEALKFRLKSTSNTTGLKNKIDALQKQLESPKFHTIHTLIEHGMYTTIIEDVNTLDLENTGAIQKAINNSKLVGKIPELGKKALRQIYMTPGTKLYDTIFKITQYSDFAARCVEYELSMQEVEEEIRNKKMLEEEANKYREKREKNILYDVRDAFVNYDKPHHSYLQYLNDMGILMFTKYLFRSQKVIMNALRHHPITAALLVAAQAGTLDFEDPTDSFWMHKLMTYPTSNIHNPVSNFISTLVPMPIQYALGWHNIIPTSLK